MKKITKVLALLLILVMTLAACQSGATSTTGSTTGTTGNGETTAGTTGTAGTETTAGTTATTAAPIDPGAKYEEPVTIKFAWAANAANATDELEDNNPRNNAWTRLFEEQYNIKTEIMWEAVDANGQYQTKLDLAIATKEMPDIIRTANYSQFIELVESGLVQDITESYDNYLSEICKTYSVQDGGLNLEFGKYDGQLMGLAASSADWNNSRMVFIRDDWKQELGLADPQSMDDVITIAKTFVDEGKATYALPLFKSLTTDNMADIQGIANAYGAFPRLWIEDGNGGVKYGSIQPEMKNAISLYADLFANNYIDPAFASLDGTKVGEQLTSGQIGVIIGPFWLPTWPLNSTYGADGTDWISYPVLPFAGVTNMKVGVKGPTGRMVCVNSDFEHPEALFKMLNSVTEKLEDPDETVQATYHSYKTTINGEETTVGVHGMNPVGFYYADQMTNLNTNPHITDAVDNNDESFLVSAHDKLQYPKVKSYADTLASGGIPTVEEWVIARLFYSDKSCYGILNQYYNGFDGQGYVVDALGGYQSKTMISMGGQLGMTEDEAFVKMISNVEGYDINNGAFDKFVADWNAMGGELVTYEVNQWFAGKN